MRLYPLSLAAAALAVSSTAYADGYAWPNRPAAGVRMQNAYFVRANLDDQAAQAQEAVPAVPAQEPAANPHAATPPAAQSYHDYPFASRCCSNTASCCNDIWRGYARPFGCGRLHGHGCGGCGGCCFGGSFAAGSGHCAGLFGGGWLGGFPLLGHGHGGGCGCGHCGLLGHHRLGLHHGGGLGLGLGCGCAGGDIAYSTPGFYGSGCASCGNGTHAPAAPVPAPPQVAPEPSAAEPTYAPPAGTEKSAFRYPVPYGYYNYPVQ